MDTRIFYKYRTFNPRNLKTLSKNTVFFASLNQLNDPEDSSYDINFDIDFKKVNIQSLINKLYKFYKDFITEIYKQESTKHYLKVLSIEDELRKNIAERPKLLAEAHLNPLIDKSYLKAESDGTDLKIYKALNAEFKNFLNKPNIGILSLSKSPDISLLWSHYAEAHTGFCIGYEIPYTDDGTCDVFEKAYSVKYQTEVPVFYIKDLMDIYEKDNIYGVFKKLFYTKRDDWRYEEEVRILGPWGEYGGWPVKEIICGDRCPKAYKDAIKGILEGLDIKSEIRFYENRKAHGEKDAICFPQKKKSL